MSINVKKVISISLLYFLLGEADETNDYVYHGATHFYGLHSSKLLPVRQDTLQCDAQSAKGRRQGGKPLRANEQRGRDEGRAAERDENARKMKAKGLDPALIAEISGLSEAELLAL